MAISDLKYKIDNNYIHNWLVAGPLSTPASYEQKKSGKENRSNILKQFTDPEAGITEIPVDLGSLGSVTQENPYITWRYYRCREDHLVDFSNFYQTCTHVRSWAYTQIVTPVAREIQMVISSNTAFDLWFNSEHIFRQKYFRKQDERDLQSKTISTILRSGTNEILIRLENVGIRETPFCFALQLIAVSDDEVEVTIPTDIEDALVVKRQTLEELIEKANLDRYIYGNLWGDRYNRNQPIPLGFSKDLEVSGEITFRLQSLNGDIFQEGTKSFEAGSCFEMAKIFPLRNGPHHLALLPNANDYYVKKLRFDRKDLFYIVRTPYSQAPYGNFKQRANEALQDASQRRNESIYCEIAKIATNQTQNVDRKIFDMTMERINKRHDGSVFELLGILGLMLRFGKKGKIPGNLKSSIKHCILNFRYWEDAPGEDVMDFHSEPGQILFHTCEILACELYPSLAFGNTGKDGGWHRIHGEDLAIDWLRQRGQYGFDEWDSPGNFEAILAALAHLVDFASSDPVRELAAVLMDKIFFSLAINSFQGAFGSTRGKTDTASVLSARLEPTSGIFRLMWGLGNFNENLMGTVSLACCKHYEFPEILHKIGTDSPAAFWNREQHGSEQPSSSRYPVNKVSYRTKDFMLSSAQDYRPGQKGLREHIWQATLGPDATVYVNHPTCMSVDDARQPNLWAGNGVLPRVAQWGDVLISIHKLPPDDWLGFTHAYFPALSFDEYQMQGKWVFARQGDGYLALMAAQGFELIKEGQTAFRELRSYGMENIWLCHMGQKLLDGSFDKFQQKIGNLRLNYNHLSVHFDSMRGDALSFGWDDPFLVNNQEQALTGFKHYENIYSITDLPASQMDIIFQDDGVRLKFQ